MWQINIRFSHFVGRLETVPDSIILYVANIQNNRVLALMSFWMQWDILFSCFWRVVFDILFVCVILSLLFNYELNCKDVRPFNSRLNCSSIN